mgnify:CR=1 FL=1
MTGIKIMGQAGQGIKFISNILAKLLVKNNYEIAVMNNYSPFIKYGNSDASIVFSKDKIENPLTEEFNFEYDLMNENLKKELEGNKKYDEQVNISLLRKIISDLKLDVSDMEIGELIKKKSH